MSSSLLKRRHSVRAGSPRAYHFAWLAGLMIAMVVAGTAIAGAGDHASRAIQGGTPTASPEASPVATPAASPAAVDLGPSTQIIVGEITIEITDDAIIPRHFESAVGRDITITVVNAGNQPHNFTIEELDIDIDLDPGDEQTVEIEQPPIGDYRYYSDLPGDEALEGVMTVFI